MNNKSAERKCVNCGTILENEDEFCYLCGTKYQEEKINSRICSECGAILEEEDDFCYLCGKKYEEEFGKVKRKFKIWKTPLVIIFLFILFYGAFFFAYKKGYLFFKLDDVIEKEEKLIMPNLIGRKESEALDELVKIYLSVEIERVEADDDKAGTVFYQSIEVGSEVKKGDKVIIKVYVSSDKVKMISVVDMPLDEAKSKLAEIGLTVVVNEANSDTVAKGNVISQGIKENTVVSKGTVVPITVSIGKASDSQTGNSNSNNNNNNNNNSENEKPNNNGSGNNNTSSNQNIPGPKNENWSDWKDSLPNGVTSDYYAIESRTMYRFKTRSTKTSNSTNAEPGWTFVGTKSEKQCTSDYIEEALPYYTYLSFKNSDYYIVKDLKRANRAILTIGHCDKLNDDGTYTSMKMPDSLVCPDDYFFHTTCYFGIDDVNHPNYKDLKKGSIYRSENCTRNNKYVENRIIEFEYYYSGSWCNAKTVTVNYFEKWSDWSNWSTNSKSGDENTKVGTKKMYRFKLK